MNTREAGRQITVFSGKWSAGVLRVPEVNRNIPIGGAIEVGDMSSGIEGEIYIGNVSRHRARVPLPVSTPQEAVH